MINIGLTGWGDHPSLYIDGTNPRNKLHAYSSHFPIVELDTSFYAIPSAQHVRKWMDDTPPTFRFVVKAYQGMTGHQRGQSPYSSIDEMFDAFEEFVQFLHEEGRLAAVLFQFPPWYDCKKEHVDYLRFAKQKMGKIPAALEFRHQSWFRHEWRDKTLAFMESEKWIHSICDEPQAGEGSVPIVLHPTDSARTIIRLHGRNEHGWVNRGQSNWREVRYLYRYHHDELLQWSKMILELQKQSKEIIVLFNNNSGGDAADNAKQLIDMLELKYEGLAPKQMNLFDF